MKRIELTLGLMLLTGAGIARAHDSSGTVKLTPEAKAAQGVAKGKAGIQWVRIPGGSFTMGDDTYGPKHQVSVKSFQMAKTLVTNKQYKACVDAGVCKAADNNGDIFSGDDQPVVGVDWNDAKTFSEWIGGRLSSEAEWEYAARSAGKDYKYPWGNEEATCDKAVINEGGYGCGRSATWPVCSKTAGNTAQGLCEMSGNAWEWVQDWYHGSYDGAPTDGSAWENPTGSGRVLRGGSWYDDAGYARSAFRNGIDPGYRGFGIGAGIQLAILVPSLSDPAEAFQSIMRRRRSSVCAKFCSTDSVVLRATMSSLQSISRWNRYMEPSSYSRTKGEGGNPNDVVARSPLHAAT